MQVRVVAGRAQGRTDAFRRQLGARVAVHAREQAMHDVLPRYLCHRHVAQDFADDECTILARANVLPERIDQHRQLVTHTHVRHVRVQNREMQVAAAGSRTAVFSSKDPRKKIKKDKHTSSNT